MGVLKASHPGSKSFFHTYLDYDTFSIINECCTIPNALKRGRMAQYIGYRILAAEPESSLVTTREGTPDYTTSWEGLGIKKLQPTCGPKRRSSRLIVRHKPHNARRRHSLTHRGAS